MRCDTNRCIPNSWVCDGQKDCNDGADEAAAACSRAACRPQQFQCAASRRCIPLWWRCDGAPDCGRGDTSDELACAARPCSAAMFPCDNGACLPWDYHCDGHADCADASDERACAAAAPPAPAPACEDHEFQCNNSECIRREFRCDAHVDCRDGSDEAGCAAPGPACAAPALRCDNATRCVPLHQLCDGAPDCADGADEADRCGEPMCAVSACSHACHAAPGGPVCACPAGLALGADGATCEARAACAAWGACAHVCVPTRAGHKCACDAGYRLADDGRNCKSTDGTTPLLVFSNRHEVRGVELPALTARALISSLKNTIALDWRRDPASGLLQLYWTDVVDDNIYRGTIVGGALSGIEPVVRQGLSTAEGLAVDWVAGNLYWVESSLHQIEVARLDGRYRRTLLAGDMDSPRAVAADPRLGYLFWSDWEQAAPRIERASLAGRARRVLLRVDALAGGAWPNGLALDYRARRLYWVDARSDSIHTSTYDGADARQVLRGHAALSHPFAITVFEAHVYWTDWRSNSVVRASKWDGSDVTVVQRTLTQPFDLKVLHPSRQPPAARNPCAGGGGCSHLCLIHSPAERDCACPHLMRLAADNVTCEPHEKVLLIARAGEIRGVDLEAPQVHMIPTVSGPHVTQPAGLQFAAAARELYWADTESSELRAAPLAGGPARVLADSGVEQPRGFALDWAAGVLYYTSRGALLAARLAGTHTAQLRRLHNASALAVDPRRGRLYWAAREPDAERLTAATGAATQPRALLDSRADPRLAGVTSLCVDVDADRLYWVNSGSSTIQYIDVATGKVTTLELGRGARPTALEVYGATLLWADAADAALRACDKRACAAASARVLRSNTEGVVALRVYDAALQRGAPGACARRARPCAHLCLPVGELASECRCAAGYDARDTACIAVDEVLVYSLSWELRGAALQEPEPEPRALLPPVPQLSVASAIDYDAAGEWLFWVDSEAGAVWRVRRDGSARARLAAGGAGDAADWPAALAADWRARNLYWSDPRRRLLLVARYDGAHRYVLLDTEPLAVTALALDPRAGWLFLGGAGGVQRARPDG
ncbi:prolow-density lipoprotein receptor-related protein 1-like, partial [Helicoverpa zea]|uniref:prolow-density lipoprotein receptor-related protein 1-like n=1 Tax=Helicoverpa zea TaxID=7113 RepID=UPI001F582092